MNIPFDQGEEVILLDLLAQTGVQEKLVELRTCALRIYILLGRRWDNKHARTGVPGIGCPDLMKAFNFM